MPELETLTPPQYSLPEFNGDLSHWERDVHVLQEAREHPEGYRYEAQLPEVIGYLTDDEVATLSRRPYAQDTYTRSYDGDEWHSDMGIEAIRQQLPSLIRIIENDIALVTNGQGKLDALGIHKKYVEANTRHRGRVSNQIDLHVDKVEPTPEGIKAPVYVVSDFEPTRFYQGGATLYRMARSIELLPDSLDPALTQATVAAPRNAIVRMSGATIHESPVFLVDSPRSFLRAWSINK